MALNLDLKGLRLRILVETVILQLYCYYIIVDN